MPPAISPLAASVGLCVLTAIVLLLLGGVTPAAASFLYCGVGALCLLTGLARPAAEASSSIRHGPGLALLLGLPLLAAMHLIARVLYPWTSAPISAIADQFVLLTAYLVFLLCAAATIRSSAQARIVILALFAIGIGEAVYGSLNLLAGNQYLLFAKRHAYLDSATGTLVNRNHFAYLLEMLLPLGFLVVTTTAEVDGSPSQRRHRTEDNARRMLLGLGVVMMLLALLLSRSRMGLISLTAASGLVLVLNRALAPAGGEAPSRRRDRTIMLILVGSALFLLVGVGIDIAFERFSRATEDLEVGRMPIWTDTWAMIKAHPLIGSGFGAFEYLNSTYRTVPTGFYVKHAHCDYLEVLAEAGIPGLAIVFAWLVFFVRRLVRTLGLPLEPSRRAVVLATAVGITSVALHSCVDFGLRMPGVTLTLLLVVAVFLQASVGPAAAGAGRGGRAK